MDNTELISIVVPVYNVENYLCEFIESALRQSITKFELILVDDGSTDNSASICDAYASNDTRIKVMHKTNGGVASARNEGLSLSEGKWIIFCDPDDTIEPRGIESLYVRGEEEEADIVFGDINLIKGHSIQPVQFYKTEFSTNDKAFKEDLIKADFSRQYCVDPPEKGPAFGYGGPWNKLVRRKLLNDCSIYFDEDLKGIFDDILYTAYIFANARKVVYIHDIVYNYRLLESSITKTYKSDLPEINKTIFRAFREFLKSYDTDGEFKQPYYAVVIRRFSCLFGQYFFNEENSKSLKEQLNELFSILNSEPYLMALKKVDQRKIHIQRDYLFFSVAQLKSPYLLYLSYELYAFTKALCNIISTKQYKKEIKKYIKLIIGQRGVFFAKKIQGEIRYIKTRDMHKNSGIFMHKCEWNAPTIIGKKGKHIFFGYYDLQQVSQDNTKLLITEVDKKASPSKDSATLEWYDLKTSKFHYIGKTSAWCWQQGTRLRWHPVDKQIVIYNDVGGETYVTKFYDIVKKRVTEVLPCAIYDITPDGEYGFTLNFSRLQRLRPGYGYNTLPDKTRNEKIPENDGVIRIDCRTKQQELIISYQQLANLTPEAQDKWNYINHISISPDGTKLMFFYIWTNSPSDEWKLKLFVSNIDGTELRCLGSDLTPSHYAWRNNDELLIVTSASDDECSRYYLYNVNTGVRRHLCDEGLKDNGHPSFMPDKNRFISDTYPLKDCMQRLFEGDVRSESATQLICNLYSDPRLFGEKRCDLHPRVSIDGSILTVDSTFQGGGRCTLMFSRKARND